jgi:hypothetical protein
LPEVLPVPMTSAERKENDLEDDYEPDEEYGPEEDTGEDTNVEDWS